MVKSNTLSHIEMNSIYQSQLLSWSVVYNKNERVFTFKLFTTLSYTYQYTIIYQQQQQHQLKIKRINELKSVHSSEWKQESGIEFCFCQRKSFITI